MEHQCILHGNSESISIGASQEINKQVQQAVNLIDLLKTCHALNK